MRKKTIILILLYFTIALVYFFLSQLSLLNEIRAKPPYTVFPYYHTNSDFDFNAYLSVITQSKNGAWLMTDPYTTEPTNPTLFYFFFILVGKFASLFDLMPNIAYQIVRIISVFLNIIMLYLLMRTLLGPIKGAWASIFATIGTIAPLSFYHEPEAYITYTDWWGNMEATNRMDQMPHYLVTTLFLYIIMMLIISFIRSPHPFKLVASFLLCIFGGLFFPPMLMPILFCLPITYILLYLSQSIKYRKLLRVNPKDLVMLIVVLSGIVIPYLLMLRENGNGFPWDVWSNWERARWRAVTAFDKKLFISFGILPYLCIPISIAILVQTLLKHGTSLMRIHRHNQQPTYNLQPTTYNNISHFKLHTSNFKLVFVVLWAYLPFILLPITNIDITFISKYRLTTMSPFVPLGLLATMTAFWVYEHSKITLLKYSLFLLLFLTTVPVTILFLPKQISFTKANKIATSFYHYYIPISDWAAIEYIRDHIPKKSVILSNRYLGNVIPAYAEVISYIGHHVHTKDFDRKNWETDNFYKNLLTRDEALTFLKSNKIQFVMFGPGEKLDSPSLTYPFLKVFYHNNGTTIYTY